MLSTFANLLDTPHMSLHPNGRATIMASADAAAPAAAMPTGCNYPGAAQPPPVLASILRLSQKRCLSDAQVSRKESETEETSHLRNYKNRQRCVSVGCPALWVWSSGPGPGAGPPPRALGCPRRGLGSVHTLIPSPLTSVEHLPAPGACYRGARTLNTRYTL